MQKNIDIIITCTISSLLYCIRNCGIVIVHGEPMFSKIQQADLKFEIFKIWYSKFEIQDSKFEILIFKLTNQIMDLKSLWLSFGIFADKFISPRTFMLLFVKKDNKIIRNLIATTLRPHNPESWGKSVHSSPTFCFHNSSKRVRNYNINYTGDRLFCCLNQT